MFLFSRQQERLTPTRTVPLHLPVSRSSLNRGFYAPDVYLDIAHDVPAERQERAFEQYGNATTFNLENVLRQNILTSSYYQQSAVPIEQWQDLVDEIYYSVDHVEPWMSGNARGPSTAFNLLYRLGQLKPTPKELRMMLDHKDSPYIRAVGFLYLRYTCNPRYLWEWFSSYVEDEEEFTPSPEGWGHSVSMGAFIRDILLDQVPVGKYYFETIFPRIPVKVTDEVEAGLRARGLPTKAVGNAGQGGEDRRGIAESAARPASVKQSLSVALGQRAPNRASARELGRGTGADLQLERVMEKGADSPAREPASREERRSRSRSPPRASRARWEEDDRRRGRDEPPRPRAPLDRDRRGDYQGDRRYDRDDDRRRGHREYDRRRGVDEDRAREYSRERRSRGYEDDDRRRAPAPRSYGQPSDRRRSPPPRFGRDGGNGGRAVSDVFKDRPASDVFRDRPASDVFRDRPAAGGYKP